jgi:hypothetical protein
LVDVGARKSVVVIQIEENSVTLTPYGSLIRIPGARAIRAKSWTAKLRAVLAFLFR